MNWLDINYIAFELLGYPLSYVELLGTVFGMLSVVLAARGHILTWPLGIVNEFFFFLLFYQVHLYSDMLLQVYFFVLTVYGWYHWNQQKTEDKVLVLSRKGRLSWALVVMVSSLLLGVFVTSLYDQLHLLFPGWHAAPPAYPWADAFTTMASVVATVLLARRYLETWVLWVLVDIVSIVLYLLKGIHLVAIEYGIFLLIASAGWYHWNQMHKKHG